MQNTTQLYRQLFLYLSQYSQHCDLRHLQALSWMVSALVCSQKLNLTAWEPYVHEGCSKSPELPAPWKGRFLNNSRICVRRLYLPLVMAALSQWGKARLYVALDTSLLVEPILPDCALDCLGWTSSAPTVAGN